MAKSLTKALKSIGLFILFFLIYHMIGCQVFPMDNAANTLSAPSWYPIVGIVLSIAFTVLCNKLAARVKSAKATSHKAKIESLEDADPQYDDLFSAAVQAVANNGYATISILQRALRISYTRAATIIDQMEDLGIVEPYGGAHPRKVINANLGKALLYARQNNKADYEDPQPLNNFKDAEEELRKVDCMEGHAFEYWCADLVEKNGFINVSVTQGSGDQGVDVLAEKDGVKYAIQCKCYSSDLGNSPIQQVNAGKTIYHCHLGIVMTNRNFTTGAKKAAEATGVLLWDRNKLVELINTASKG